MTIKEEYKDSTVDLLARNSRNWEDGRSNYIHLKQSIKAHLIKINRGTCFFCKSYINTSNNAGTVEHILDKDTFPVFSFRPNNLIYCCTMCNSLKRNNNVLVDKQSFEPMNMTYDDYPNESSNYLIIHPYFDDYYEYIEIDDIFYIAKNNNNKAINTINIYHLSRLDLAEDKIRNREESFKNGFVMNALVDFSEDVYDRVGKLTEDILDNAVYVTNNPGRFIDKHLNQDNDSNKRTRTAIESLDNINVEVFRQFREIARIIDRNQINYENEILQKQFFLGGNINLKIDSVKKVLNSLGIILGEKQRRCEVSIISIQEMISMSRQFEYYRDKYHLNNNIVYIDKLKLLIECKDLYDIDDFILDIKDKISKDKKYLKLVSKLYRESTKKIVNS